MVSRGVKRAANIQRLISKMDKFITAILVGNNFVNIAISSIVAALCILHFGYKWGVIIATLLTAFFIVIICEITPKIIAIRHTERSALLIAPLMEVFIRVFGPFIWLFGWVSNLIIRMLGLQPAKRSPLVTEEELRLMIEMGKEEGFLSIEKGRMLQRIFEFGNTKVHAVMVPLAKMVSVSADSTLEQLLDTLAEEGHARLPVYKGQKEHITGILYARDLLYVLRDKGLFLIQDLIHEAYFVPQKMPVNELLAKFQLNHIQIAIVVDEQKKAVGLVTLEDLIEEIVGEIEEKHTRR